MCYLVIKVAFIDITSYHIFFKDQTFCQSFFSQNAHFLFLFANPPILCCRVIILFTVLSLECRCCRVLEPQSSHDKLVLDIPYYIYLPLYHGYQSTLKAFMRHLQYRLLSHHCFNVDKQSVSCSFEFQEQLYCSCAVLILCLIFVSFHTYIDIFMYHILHRLQFNKI